MAKAHHGVHSGTKIFCTDRRVKGVFIANAMKKKGVPSEIVHSVMGSYGHENAGNKFHDTPDMRSKMELGFHKDHPGTHLSVIGHDEGCGGMKLTHNLLNAARKGESRAKFLKDRAMGSAYKEVNRDLGLYTPFLYAIRKSKGKKGYGEFMESEDFRMALEEFNVFLQLSKASKDRDFKRHEKAVMKEHGKGISLVGGIYTPKEAVKDGKKVPVQGTIRFTYPHLSKALGGKKNVDALLRKLGLKHRPGSPTIERI